MRRTATSRKSELVLLDAEMQRFKAELVLRVNSLEEQVNQLITMRWTAPRALDPDAIWPAVLEADLSGAGWFEDEEIKP